jgi:predicted O-methyltransferase YrrM
MVNYFKPKEILELGTSLGITASYLASANKGPQVTTLEGAATISTLAQQTFNAQQLTNIKLITGNFDDTLKDAVTKNYDFVFIDGNHRKEPTLRYFQQLLSCVHNNSVMVFDDIHWSKEMEGAWEEIKNHSSVTLTVDLFFIGLVFFRKEQKEKEHFVLRF